MMTSPASSPRQPCRLLALPVELRLRIYEYALTAPSHAISLYYSFHMTRTNPSLALPLLRTCRQIHTEAADVLFQQNTVLVPANCFGTTGPVITSSHLPPYALARLRRLFVIFDVLDAQDARASYARVDFRPFQAMVRLRRLRIAVINHADWAQERAQERYACWTELLDHVVERVPRGCGIEYGAQTEVEKTFVAPWVELLNVPVLEAGGETLRRAAGYCRVEQGGKSGSEEDWREGGADAEGPGVEEVRTW